MKAARDEEHKAGAAQAGPAAPGTSADAAAEAGTSAQAVEAEVIDFDEARAKAGEADSVCGSAEAGESADADAAAHATDGEAGGADGGSVDAADAAGDAAPGDELLRAAQEKAAALQDRYARLQAEWDNFRKRTNAERDSERVRAAESLVKDLLPVLDDLERALKHARESGEGGTLADGVEAVQTKFLQILGKHRVSQVEAHEQPFDATRHQAVGTTEDASVPEETVVQVYQQGYQMGDKIIRPAMVVTSTGGPARGADEAGGADAAPADVGGHAG